MEAARDAGNFVAGYLSYELGYALERKLARLSQSGVEIPLMWFGVFEPPLRCSSDEFFVERSAGRAYVGSLQHEWSEDDYAARFRRVRALIEAGDIYQANLTFRSAFSFVGDALQLYRSLRASSAASHCAYVDDGRRQILSLSPELFFKLSAEGRIASRPMKGTAARGTDSAGDAALCEWLRTNPKERAENLMIVDLTRNDLSRVAKLGSVSVPELFVIESYPTLHQMVSSVVAELNPATSVYELIRALFPCGSVTGVPKIRAMEVLHELESRPRGAYCGAIGYFAPDGSASFNVAIRTVTIEGNKGELGIGGGVVHDSQMKNEYAECHLKAKYFESARRPIQLIETLRWSPMKGFKHLPSHMARMEGSAGEFGIDFCRQSAFEALNRAVSSGAVVMLVRLVLFEDGRFECEAAVLSNSRGVWRCTFSPVSVLSEDTLLQHKTSWREVFDEEHARVKTLSYDEVIFTNEKGEVTEGSRTNVFARLDGKLVTPPLSCGLLNGCLRQELIDTDQCTERVLFRSDLREMFVGNSVRGLSRARID